MTLFPSENRVNWTSDIKKLIPFQEPTIAIKQGHTFATFDPCGDIISPGDRGIYHHDTRFLSRLEFRLNGERPLLGSSNVQEDNALMTVDMTNADITSSDRTILSRGRIHINRLKYLWDNAYYERFLLHNFDNQHRILNVEIKFGADFVDLFEVRGERRARRGPCSAVLRSEGSAILSYVGLDAVERKTFLEFEPAPTRLSTNIALFVLAMGPGEGVRFILTIGFDSEPEKAVLERGFYSSLRAARRALRASSGRAASLDSANSLFNEFARRSIADLFMLLTETAYGQYPFAGIPWFGTSFGRDGILTALFALSVDPSIAKGVMRVLAATQSTDFKPEREAEPGKILHEMRDGEMARLGEVPFARYYGSVDATPLFVILVGEYFRRTGDLETIRELWPNVQAALNWIEYLW